MEQNELLIKTVCYCTLFVVYTSILYVMFRRKGFGIKEVLKLELLYAIVLRVSFSATSLVDNILTSTYATEHEYFEILIEYKTIVSFIVSFIASWITAMILMTKFKNFFSFTQKKKVNDEDSLEDEEKVPLSV